MSVEFKKNFNVKNLTSFKIGGGISKIYFPKSIKEFEEIAASEDFIEVFGNWSNTLVSSDGYDGVVILTSKMDTFGIEEDTIFFADCGAKGPKLAQIAQIAGLSGFEFMIGFPGSLGGNIYMNASAHGQCISDYLENVVCWSKEKGIFSLKKDEMEFGYRTSVCQKENIVVLGAEFKLKKKSPEEIKAKMEENLAFRKSHQPNLAIPNCGSVFKNPEGNSAGSLLDEVGAKNFVSGGVKVWENHANFIVNPDKTGTSIDVLELMYKMFTTVKEKYKIELRPEVKYLGNKNKREDELCKILNIKQIKMQK